MKISRKLVCEYVYSHDVYGFECTKQIPCNKAKLTGKYREINKKIYVEVEEKVFFGLKTITRFISEENFYFKEIEEFDCKI